MPIDVSYEKTDCNVKSQFTKEADMAFDEFCRIYLNSSNGFLTETSLRSEYQQMNHSKQNDLQKAPLVEEKPQTIPKNVELSQEKFRVISNSNTIGCTSNRFSVHLEKYPYEKTNAQTFSRKEFRYSETLKPKQAAYLLTSIRKPENGSFETSKCENQKQNNQSKDNTGCTKNQVEFSLVKSKHETLKTFDNLLAQIESERKLKKKSHSFNIARSTLPHSNSLIKEVLASNVKMKTSVNIQTKTTLNESKELVISSLEKKSENNLPSDHQSTNNSKTSETKEKKSESVSTSWTLNTLKTSNSINENQNQVNEKKSTTVDQVCNYLDLINDKTLIEEYEILSNLSTYYPFLDIPKKKKFSDEFYAKSLPKKVTENFYSRKNQNKENEDISYLCNRISPYIVARAEHQQKQVQGQSLHERSTHRLGLKMSICGMCKGAKLPIPKANYFIDKGNFGDDAGFFAENNFGEAIGIADGATGNCIFGYDPGDFSRQLMKSCSELFMGQSQFPSAKQLLMNAYENVQKTKCYGSCTACVFTLEHRSSQMTAVNIGDSGYCLIREGKIVEKSEPTRLSQDCPKQLDSYPWKEESRRNGVSYTDILSNDTHCETIKVLKDDIIIVSSDGLFDNLTFDEIEQINSRSKSIMDLAENLVNQSVKFYRKPDDILVIVAKVVENKDASLQQCFSNQTKK